MVVTAITCKEDFDKELAAAGGKLVIVDFSAAWCGPCKMIGPKFEAMSSEFTDAVFLKVDVDEVGEVAEEYEVSAMPTFKFIKNGIKVDDLVGASEAKLRELIEKNYK